MLPRNPALLHGAARRFADYPGGHAEGFPDTFKQLFRDVYEYIEAGDLQAPGISLVRRRPPRGACCAEAILRPPPGTGAGWRCELSPRPGRGEKGEGGRVPWLAATRSGGDAATHRAAERVLAPLPGRAPLRRSHSRLRVAANQEWPPLRGWVGGVSSGDNANATGFRQCHFGRNVLGAVLTFAGDEGFGCVEVMCWPPGRADRRYAGVTHWT